VWALALSPDGSKLASGGWDQTIKVWDVASGKDVNTIKAHLGTVTAIVFADNGQIIISGGRRSRRHGEDLEDCEVSYLGGLQFRSGTAGRISLTDVIIRT